MLLKGGEQPAMTDKQKRFCNEYLVDCNATQAAIRAGYSPKTANEQGNRLLANVSIKSRIEEMLEKMQKPTIATAEEVLEYLTSVVRGESKSDYLVVEGIGDGCSEARSFQKKPDEKDRIKAAELLGKRYRLFADKVNVEGALPVILSGEESLEE